MAVGVLPRWRGAPSGELAVSVHPGCVVHGKGLERKEARLTEEFLTNWYQSQIQCSRKNSIKIKVFGNFLAPEWELCT